MFYPLLKPLLFQLPPEKAHDLAMQIARLSPMLGAISGVPHEERLKLTVGNIDWHSPVGLAAGLDKNAEALEFFAGQGFGAIECGTITLRPQLGNPKPRMFRYPEESSLRNAMGFPNQGMLEILPRLKAYQGPTPIGANIGKNKDSSPEESIEELSVLFDTLESYVDYFVVNVSSPNTPGLRALQEKSYLTELFTTLNESRRHSPKDLYLKIAPDLEESKVLELTHLVHELKLTGLIATNTTIMPERGAGGVSGVLLRERSRKIRKIILQERLPIELIGVGGISTTQDLLEFWSEGGKAVQVYTGYIFQGPSLLRNIQRDLLQLLKRLQLKDLNTFFALSPAERQRGLRDAHALEQ